MTILAGKLTHESGELIIQLQYNPLNISIVSAVQQTDLSYVVTIDKPVLNSDMPPKWYIASSEGNIYAVTQTSSITFVVQSFNPPATPVENILSGNEFQLEIY
jgi:hypothetical protein